MRGIDVTDLLGQPGSSRALHIDDTVPDLRLELAAVEEGRPIVGDLILESVVEGIFVTGRLQGEMTLSCARCLKSFGQAFDVDINEMFVQGATPQDDEYRLELPGSIDLEPMVRDAVLLQMPFSPLCRIDCKGLCPRCGGDRNLGECTCGPEELDTRWAALGQIKFD